MSNYRRVWVPGGTYFFTVNLRERRRDLLVTQVDALRRAFITTRQAHPFRVVAIVVLPDHLHCIWQLPGDDADNAARWARIRSLFSRSVPADEYRSAVRLRLDERGIWHRRYWEHLLRDGRDVQTHVDYIHRNPVKHGYVATPHDWPYSSVHRYRDADSERS